jgi:hypothetical protein
MASVALSRRVRMVVAYPPLCDMSDLQRREFHEALLDADNFEEATRARRLDVSLKGTRRLGSPGDALPRARLGEPDREPADSLRRGLSAFGLFEWRVPHVGADAQHD